MASLSEPTNTVWPFPFPPQDWEQTPAAVQVYVHSLQDELTQLREHVEALEARASRRTPRPPTGRRRRTRRTRSLAGIQPPPRPVKRAGNLAIRAIARRFCLPRLLGSPSDVREYDIGPDQAIPYASGAGTAAHRDGRDALGIASRLVSRLRALDQSARPPNMPQATDLGSVPSWGTGWDIRERPTYRANVLCLRVAGPHCFGAIQKVLDRVTQAIDPYYVVMARQARQAPANYIDETPWYCLNRLEWLWVMASERVAFYMIHPRRPKKPSPPSSTAGRASWSAMDMGSIKVGSRPGKPA